ncbi:MAG: YfaZ family protein [Gammaproteobacteria bacterium]|nr:YfaZ family protein [Gammaproteobacteria bacterium]MCW8840361.1 YfaZ family protein [Gammaproteobacteria bacterium]MCW8927310.1 YfaZ family protein [Gammaproteobacteria bacterium]MCW8957533.1 YfaZ family protein [Gammaproteobacteria bacterium]MCW8972768.1 YfaZ family protein [Gammaproteobacteria bacterium]
MKLRAAGLVLLGGITTTAVADNVDVNLRDDALRAGYSMEMNDGLSANFGFLLNDDDKQLDDTMLHAGLLVSGENWSEKGTFDISLGGRVIYAAPDNVDLAALALGGELRFSPVHRLGIGGSAYYAPGITAFMDAEAYSEFGIKVDYQVLPQAFVYVGYRSIEVDIENGPDNVELDEGVHVGVKMLF